MRLIVRVLGTELLAIELDWPAKQVEPGPETFGFHGGSGGQIEHAGDQADHDTGRPSVSFMVFGERDRHN